jgi:hypothetical protein
MIDGVWEGPSTNPWLLPMMERIHHYAREATESEVRFRIGYKRWAEIYAPSEPAANPTRTIDLDTHIAYRRKSR